MKRFWNTAIRSLMLVRLGQTLGTDSDLARLVHDAIEALLICSQQILG